MSFVERAFVFDCDRDVLVGIAALPRSQTTTTGVLIIVGGPQYRVGSHRQFVLLSRELATQGIPCMRFDYRGMGDATGVQRSFEAVHDDIRAAVDCFQARVPAMKRIVLWGLCDGASAACYYAPMDRRVAGLVLLNPWVRTESGEAKTYLKHYYLRQFFDLAFWKRLGKRQVAVGDSLAGALRTLRLARLPRPPGNGGESLDLPSRMAASLEKANLPMLLVLSGHDYVANEFDEVVRAHQAWSELTARANVERLEAADHTFSKAEWRDAVAQLTASWVLHGALNSPSQGPDHPPSRSANPEHGPAAKAQTS